MGRVPFQLAKCPRVGEAGDVGYVAEEPGRAGRADAVQVH
jgi:hypothetical protein